MKKLIKMRMVMLMVVTGCFGVVRMSETAAESRSMIAAVTREKITISVSGVGSSGTGTLVSYDAYDYHPSDPYKGLSKADGSSMVKIADYACGSNDSFEIDRYDENGNDRLYRKYYVLKGEKILAGPVYATEIESLRSVPAFERTGKKGLIIG